jgi:hypothetical protein
MDPVVRRGVGKPPPQEREAARGAVPNPQAQAVGRFAYPFGPRFDRRDALDNPEPCASPQARVAAGQHAKSRSKQDVHLLKQSGLSSQHRIGQPSRMT